MSDNELSETTQMLLRDAECREHDAFRALRKAESDAERLVTTAKRDYLDAQRNLEKFRVQMHREKYVQIHVHVTSTPAEVEAGLDRALNTDGEVKWLN